MSKKLSVQTWRFNRFFNPDLSFHNLYDKLFLVLFIVDIALRLIWLDKPQGSLIFDEWYYVNVARVILRLPQSLGSSGQPPYPNAVPGLDPNHEHPPLAKLLIALSMYFLGDNGYGWRIPSVIFGALSVLIFYLLMKKIAKFKAVPLIAAFLFSFDTLIFVQSRIAILDIFTLTFMLLGFYWYFSGHPYLSALGMAIATLTKLPGLAGFAIIVVVHTMRLLGGHDMKNVWNSIFSWFEKYLITFVVSFLLILAVLDRLWVGYSNPFEHIQFMLTYSGGLVSSCPNGIISCPWQWLINQIQIPYLIINVQVSGGSSVTKYDSVTFWGMMNPTILYLTIPAMLYSAYSYFDGQNDFSLFVLVWFAASYLPYLPAVILAHRVTYLFYFLLPMPAVAGGVAHMIADQNPPKAVVIFYLSVVLVWFYLMFPFKVIPS